MDYLFLAKETFKIEAEAILNLQQYINEDFNKIVNRVLNISGRLVITGMGKSGHIAKKIAATLASTGTPSFFMHPAEAYHGDLGMLTSDDMLLAISNSGESEEIINIIPIVKKMGITLIGMCGNRDSTLGRESDYFLNIHVDKEACPLGLAPMASTTASLAMGDALAAVLMRARDFQPTDFALYHPGGSLGKRLLTRVKDLLKNEELPTVLPKSPFQEIITTMTSGKKGLCIVTEEQKVIGIITDGDLRRALEKTDRFRFDLRAEDIMQTNPKFIDDSTMAIEAKKYMVENKIKELLVMRNDKLLGVIQLYDLGFI